MADLRWGEQLHPEMGCHLPDFRDSNRPGLKTDPLLPHEFGTNSLCPPIWWSDSSQFRKKGQTLDTDPASLRIIQSDNL
jgi:hypothetical protein